MCDLQAYASSIHCHTTRLTDTPLHIIDQWNVLYLNLLQILLNNQQDALSLLDNNGNNVNTYDSTTISLDASSSNNNNINDGANAATMMRPFNTTYHAVIMQAYLNCDEYTPIIVK